MYFQPVEQSARCTQFGWSVVTGRRQVLSQVYTIRPVEQSARRMVCIGPIRSNFDPIFFYHPS